MPRGQHLTHPDALDMPEGFDPSGIPQYVFGRTEAPLCASHRPGTLPGLAPASAIATVETLEAQADGRWLAWGSLGDRPVLFSVEESAAAEMADSLARGELTTAIVEPAQILVERLD